MLERSEKVSLENVHEKAAKLVRTNPNIDKVGFASLAIYIAFLIIAIGLLVAIYFLLK